MSRLAIVIVSLVFLSCKGNSGDQSDEKSFTYESFAKRFREVPLPYQLSDEGLIKNKDTVSLKPAELKSFLPDSIIKKVFPRAGQVKYIPLVTFEGNENEKYFILKTINGRKRSSIVIGFEKEGSNPVSMVFLAPDDDKSTSQVSTIDKSFTISRSITRQQDNEIIEGKDVFAYSPDAKKFMLIMTDPLVDVAGEVINPIDTLSRKHKLAGDYIKDKRNLVSIRDGRASNMLMAFVHIDRNDGECTGELKGELLLTSGSTAVYRQGGDPCALIFNFKGNTVTLKEEQGCGNHRGVNCPFDGSYTKKKAAKAKTTKAKSKK